MRNNVNSPWTDQRIVDLRQLLSDGLTFAQIADEIGCGLTRCAVSGKVNRLGLCTHVDKRTPEEIEIAKHLKNERRKARRRALCFISGSTLRVRRQNRPRPPRPTSCEEIKPRHLTLIELGPHDCHWPYGNKPYTFCGLDQYEGSSYCLHPSFAA